MYLGLKGRKVDNYDFLLADISFSENPMGRKWARLIIEDYELVFALIRHANLN